MLGSRAVSGRRAGRPGRSRCCHSRSAPPRAPQRRRDQAATLHGVPDGPRRRARRHTHRRQGTAMADSRQLRRLVDYNHVGGRADPRRDRRSSGPTSSRQPREAYCRPSRPEPAPHRSSPSGTGSPGGTVSRAGTRRSATPGATRTPRRTRPSVASSPGLSDADADRVVRFTDLRGTRARSCWPMRSSTSSTTARRTGRRRVAPRVAWVARPAISTTRCTVARHP